MFRKLLPTAVAAALLLTGCSSEEPDDPTPTAAPTSGQSPAGDSTNPDTEETSGPDGVPAGRRGVTVYVDGWSVATAGVNTLRWSLPNDTSGSAQLEPLTTEEVAALRAELPDVVQRTAARMISPVRNLRCPEDAPAGCGAGSPDTNISTFSDQQIATLDDVPLSDVYDAWDVNAGIYRAALDIPENAQQVTVSLASSDPFRMTLQAGGDRAAATTGTSNDVTEGPVYDPDAISPIGSGFGYNQDTFLLSYAFGQLFYLEPSWLDPDQGLELYDPPGNNADPNIDPAEVGHPNFSGGLGTPVQQAKALSGSQLTRMTSPTTGCRPEIYCAPTHDGNVVRDVVSVDVGPMCNPDDTPRGSDAAGLQEVVSLTVADWTVTTDRPIHQSGWPASGGTELFSDPQAELNLFEGSSQQRIAEVAFFEDDPVRLLATLGVVQQPDVEFVDTVAAMRDLLGQDATC